MQLKKQKINWMEPVACLLVNINIMKVLKKQLHSGTMKDIFTLLI